MSKTVFQLIEEHGLKGLRIYNPMWGNKGAYVEYTDGIWIDEKGAGFFMSDSDWMVWELYKEKPKMVTWYRPKLIQPSGSRIVIHMVFYKSKEDFYRIYDDAEVINDEWETIQVPENIGEGL